MVFSALFPKMYTPVGCFTSVLGNSISLSQENILLGFANLWKLGGAVLKKLGVAAANYCGWSHIILQVVALLIVNRVRRNLYLLVEDSLL